MAKTDFHDEVVACHPDLTPCPPGEEMASPNSSDDGFHSPESCQSPIEETSLPSHNQETSGAKSVTLPSSRPKILVRSNALSDDSPDFNLQVKSSSLEGSSSSGSGIPSRGSSTENYTDSTGTDLKQFFIQTLNRDPKDRDFLLKIEKITSNFVINEGLDYFRFDPMQPYQRMLVHRVAAFFGLEHNVDSTNAVIVNKTIMTRIPDFKFEDNLKKEFNQQPETRKSILKRSSYEAASLKSSSFQEMSEKPPPLDNRKSKSFEEREVEYEKTRARIFNQEVASLSSIKLLQKSSSAGTESKPVLLGCDLLPEPPLPTPTDTVDIKKSSEDESEVGKEDPGEKVLKVPIATLENPPEAKAASITTCGPTIPSPSNNATMSQVPTTTYTSFVASRDGILLNPFVSQATTATQQPSLWTPPLDYGHFPGPDYSYLAAAYNPKQPPPPLLPTPFAPPQPPLVFIQQPMAHTGVNGSGGDLEHSISNLCLTPSVPLNGALNPNASIFTPRISSFPGGWQVQSSVAARLPAYQSPPPSMQTLVVHPAQLNPFQCMSADGNTRGPPPPRPSHPYVATAPYHQYSYHHHSTATGGPLLSFPPPPSMYNHLNLNLRKPVVHYNQQDASGFCQKAKNSTRNNKSKNRNKSKNSKSSFQPSNRNFTVHKTGEPTPSTSTTYQVEEFPASLRNTQVEQFLALREGDRYQIVGPAPHAPEFVLSPGRHAVVVTFASPARAAEAARHIRLRPTTYC